jgi:hypothetical protein
VSRRLDGAGLDAPTWFLLRAARRLKLELCTIGSSSRNSPVLLSW